jgi:glycoside/pentoside/hexuronide:cation symporter, GPH family
MGRPPLTTVHKAAFACGAAGWALGDRLLMTYALYFYAPPLDEGLLEKLPIWTVLGAAVPVWALISIFGRVVDSVTDPLVASWTDRSAHPFGRRRIFMLWGVLPLAVCTAAVFFPPVAGPSWTNAAFAALALGAYFTAFTIYACPFQALLPDLARTDRDRLDLSTFQAIAMLVGAAIVMIGAPLALGARPDEPRFQVVAIAFAGVSLLFMLVPIAFIPEPRLVGAAVPTSLPLIASIRATLRAPGMGWYLVGTIAFWFGFNTVASGVPYFVTVLMKEPAAYAGTVLTATFVVAAACFPVVNVLAKRIGKRKTMMLGGAALAAVMCAVPLIDSRLSGIVIMGVGGFPIAVLMAVPNALLADLATSEARRSGENREAMFFGAQAFFLKVNLGVSAGVLAALLGLGKSVAQPLGVQAIGPATAGVLALTVFCFWRFRAPSDPTS